jgi:Saccharopine dehydrogenase NADP binding domain
MNVQTTASRLQKVVSMTLTETLRKEKTVGSRILIIGLGNLGRRLAASLAQHAEVSELIVAGRSLAEGPALAAFLAACGETRVRFATVDASQRSSIEHLLRRERPDIVVQCACLMSPWYLSTHPGPRAATIEAAGFAAQVPAQLPLLMNVMEAVRSIDFQGPVINCSYPDVTNPILDKMGLAPTIGIGNVSMIRARVLAGLRERGASGNDAPLSANLPLVRVLAHHAHVTPVMLSRCPADTESMPRVYLGENDSVQRADELAYAGTPLRSNPGLSALSASSALLVIRAFLPESEPLRTSAPGPAGLPGGYPIVIADGQIKLDLPPGLSLDEAIDFQNQSARLDGVEAIAENGTVIFTEATKRSLRKLDPRLAEPLHPSQAEQRFRVLKSILEAEAR